MDEAGKSSICTAIGRMNQWCASLARDYTAAWDQNGHRVTNNSAYPIRVVKQIEILGP